MSRHAARDDDEERRPPALSPRQIRVLSLVAIFVGSIAGTAGITVGAVYWSHDQLVTPRGWVVIAGTTLFALGCFLGPFGLARARDRELQNDAAAAVERLVATARVLEPLIEPMLSHADMLADLAALAAQVEQNTRLITKLDEEHMSVVRRSGLQTLSQVRQVSARIGKVEQSLTTIESSHRVFERVMEVMIKHGVPRQGKRAEPVEIDRDAAWMADMAEAMELGRKLQQRGGEDASED